MEVTFLELGGNFFDHFGVLGRLWTSLVPGDPGRRPCQNTPLNWSTLWLHFGFFLIKRCCVEGLFLEVFWDGIYMDFERFWYYLERFLEHFFVFFLKA